MERTAIVHKHTARLLYICTMELQLSPHATIAACHLATQAVVALLHCEHKDGGSVRNLFKLLLSLLHLGQEPLEAIFQAVSIRVGRSEGTVGLTVEGAVFAIPNVDDQLWQADIPMKVKGGVRVNCMQQCRRSYHQKEQMRIIMCSVSQSCIYPKLDY